LTIRAAFEREGPNVYLILDLENNSGVPLTVIYFFILRILPSNLTLTLSNSTIPQSTLAKLFRLIMDKQDK
jgi:hypothetical protein